MGFAESAIHQCFVCLYLASDNIYCIQFYRTYVVYAAARKTSGQLFSTIVALQSINVVYLISPECDRRVFARTSSKIPGSPPTLQNGINTAAFPLFEEPGELSALLDRSGVCFSAFRSTFNVEGVKGLVKDIMTLE